MTSKIQTTSTSEAPTTTMVLTAAGNSKLKRICWLLMDSDNASYEFKDYKIYLHGKQIGHVTGHIDSEVRYSFHESYRFDVWNRAKILLEHD